MQREGAAPRFKEIISHQPVVVLVTIEQAEADQDGHTSKPSQVAVINTRERK